MPVGLAVFVTVLLHNSICASIFDFFICDPTTHQGFKFKISEDTSESYLIKDYKIVCESDKYKQYYGFSMFMMVMYVIVFPIALAATLYSNRKNNRPDGPLAFLTQNFKPHMWWYEILGEARYQLTPSGHFSN